MVEVVSSYSIVYLNALLKYEVRFNLLVLLCNVIKNMSRKTLFQTNRNLH